jgi:peptidyl-prolyl cis-trans isomerase B (cyclophilin B)
MKANLILEKGNKLVVIDFFEKEAPKTVENFKTLADKGYYDGLSFHRVIPGFVAQGGCPIGNGTGGPGYTIKCETDGNNKKHLVGRLSMAHAGKNTGGSQFFICYDSFPHLDGIHTIFGEVVEGMEYVFEIKQGDKIKEIKFI